MEIWYSYIKERERTTKSESFPRVRKTRIESSFYHSIQVGFGNLKRFGHDVPDRIYPERKASPMDQENSFEMSLSGVGSSEKNR